MWPWVLRSQWQATRAYKNAIRVMVLTCHTPGQAHTGSGCRTVAEVGEARHRGLVPSRAPDKQPRFATKNGVFPTNRSVPVLLPAGDRRRQPAAPQWSESGRFGPRGLPLSRTTTAARQPLDRNRPAESLIYLRDIHPSWSSRAKRGP